MKTQPAVVPGLAYKATAGISRGKSQDKDIALDRIQDDIRNAVESHILTLAANYHGIAGAEMRFITKTPRTSPGYIQK